MRKFRHELSRMWPRLVYFLKHGQLHPEVRPDYGLWPKYEIVGVPTAKAGTSTVHYRGESVTYSHDLKLLSASDPRVDWALQWVNADV